MKISKYFIPALLSPLMLVGCADWDKWGYDVEKPNTIAEYEYPIYALAALLIQCHQKGI